MFVIITYDIKEERVDRVRKKLKQYLTWTQNSVFEGELTVGKLKKCLAELKTLIKQDEDSIYVYKVENIQNVSKSVVGKEKNSEDMFL